MLALLTLRFRRHIAWFLYFVLYSQMGMAAMLHHHDAAGSRVRPAAKKAEVRLPFVSAPQTSQEWMPLTDGSDSGVIPARSNSRMPDFAASPSFKLPQAPLAGRGNDQAAGALNRADRMATAIGGPNQPEMQSFTSVGANNMVDLFSGDFSYNIPLLDVGG